MTRERTLEILNTEQRGYIDQFCSILDLELDDLETAEMVKSTFPDTIEAFGISIAGGQIILGYQENSVSITIENPSGANGVIFHDAGGVNPIYREGVENNVWRLRPSMSYLDIVDRQDREAMQTHIEMRVMIGD
jgi:hypothetical protein